MCHVQVPDPLHIPQLTGAYGDAAETAQASINMPRLSRGDGHAAHDAEGDMQQSRGVNGGGNPADLLKSLITDNAPLVDVFEEQGQMGGHGMPMHAEPTPGQCCAAVSALVLQH